MPTHAHLASPPADDLRNQFVAEVRRRLRPIRGRIRHFAGYPTDGFELTEMDRDGDETDVPDSWPAPPTGVTQASTPRAKARAFSTWLRRTLKQRLLEPAPRQARRLKTARPGRREDVLSEWTHWTVPFVLGAYVSGWETAGARLRTAGLPISDTQLDNAAGVGAVAGSTAALTSLQLLFADTYSSLDSIASDAAADAVEETIEQAITDGGRPDELAKALTKDLRTLQHTRAEVVATDLPTRAATDAHLDRYEGAGVEAVGHGAWQTTGLASVCPFCRRLGGESFTIDELRGTRVVWRGQTYRLAPPAHNRGECWVVPSTGSKPTTPLSDRVPGRVISTSAPRRRS